MPNYCSFDLKAVGKKENLLKLISYLKADYNYDSMMETCECSADKHFYRIFDFDVNEPQDIIEGSFTGYGCCAWSVWSCMFDGDSTYYDHNKNIPYAKHTNMLEASKELDLEIEIYSEESGINFEEHFLIRKGVLVDHKCVDYENNYELDEDGEETGEWEKVGGFGDYNWAI